MSNTKTTPTTKSQTELSDLSLPEPLTGADRLRMLYRRPGPYVSVYLSTMPLLPDAEADTLQRWQMLRSGLAAEGAPESVLQAVDARLALPVPEDAAAIAILSGADATTVVDYGQEPPRTDMAVFDVLPYAAPILEWDQARVPHIVITIDDAGADVVAFGPERYSRLETFKGTPADLAEPVSAMASATNARLVIVSGKAFLARRLAADLTSKVPVECRIVAEPELFGVDELADAAVRHVADEAARGTVGYLRELRFLAAHDAAVDGTADTIMALRDQNADVLLIHDDPDDMRRVWIGPEAHDVSLESRADHHEHARLVDAAIRAAIVNEARVHIIPTTGANGPADNTAVLSRSTESADAKAQEI